MYPSNWASEWGKPCTDAPEVLTAAHLIERLYRDLRQYTGGPLHVILDDGNIYDEDIDHYVHNADRYAYLWDGTYRRWAQAGDDVSEGHRRDIASTCDAILHLFDSMTEPMRAAALAWAHGTMAEHMPAYYDAVLTAERRAAVADDAIELLNDIASGVIKVGRAERTAKACVPVPCPPFTHHGGPDAPPHVVEVGADLRAHYERMFADVPVLTSHPLLGTGDGPEFKWSTHWVIHPDGRIEGTHWTAEDVIAAVGFRPAAPGEQVTVHATYSAQARRALGELREE